MASKHRVGATANAVAPTPPGSTSQAALEVSNISKRFGPNLALHNVDLTVASGEVHALLGENGSGKSTLIKLLAGVHQPDSGTVRIGGQPLHSGSPHAAFAVGCRFVHQDLGLVGNISVADNMFLSSGFPSRFGTVRRSLQRSLAKVELDSLELDVSPDTMVDQLSPAQRSGVAIARALLGRDSNPVRLIVFDEPTATLPEHEVERLRSMARSVASSGVGVLYVTHRLDEIFGLADNLTVLRDGRKVAERPVAGLNHQDVVNLLIGPGSVGLLTPADSAAQISDQGTMSYGPVLDVDSLTAERIGGVSFTARRGEFVGIAGITGSGRETVLGAVFGGIPRASGVIRIDGDALPSDSPRASITAGVAYLPADRKIKSGIMPLSAQENLMVVDVKSAWRWPRMSKRYEREQSRHWFSELSVRPFDGAGRSLDTFSGGNQQKVLLAKWLRTRPRVVLLDEPTQGVDVGAKSVIYQQLASVTASGGTVIVSSSDVDELVALCDRVLVMQYGRVTSILAGADINAATVSHAILSDQEEVESPNDSTT